MSDIQALLERINATNAILEDLRQRIDQMSEPKQRDWSFLETPLPETFEEAMDAVPPAPDGISSDRWLAMRLIPGFPCVPTATAAEFPDCPF